MHGGGKELGDRPRQRDQEATGVEVMLAYHVELTPDDNDHAAGHRAQSLPMVVSFGARSRGCARVTASRCDRDGPGQHDCRRGTRFRPSDRAGTLVRLPMLTTLKIELYRAVQRSAGTRAPNWPVASVGSVNRWIACFGSIMRRGGAKSRQQWPRSARASRSTFRQPPDQPAETRRWPRGRPRHIASACARRRPRSRASRSSPAAARAPWRSGCGR